MHHEFFLHKRVLDFDISDKWIALLSAYVDVARTSNHPYSKTASPTTDTHTNREKQNRRDELTTDILLQYLTPCHGRQPGMPVVVLWFLLKLLVYEKYIQSVMCAAFQEKTSIIEQLQL